MKLTVEAIFLMDGNWKTFKEHREIIRKPLRDEEIDEVEKMLNGSPLLMICRITC